jgi:hypothetical protein
MDNLDTREDKLIGVAISCCTAMQLASSLDKICKLGSEQRATIEVP